MQNEITTGNYKATVKQVTDGYGDSVYRVKVLYTNGARFNGDVLFLKDYSTPQMAMAAARREIEKRAL